MGDFISAPDERRFCTSPGRPSIRQGRQRFNPLQVGRVNVPIEIQRVIIMTVRRPLTAADRKIGKRYSLIKEPVARIDPAAEGAALLINQEGMATRRFSGGYRKTRGYTCLTDNASPLRKIPYLDVFLAPLDEQVSIVKHGISSRVLKMVADDLQVDKAHLMMTLGLARSTVGRKLKQGDPLSLPDSERLLGVMRLIGQVKQMVEESGDSGGFNASEWVGRWLEQPVPALGGRKPSEYMDTAAGQQLVSQLLRQAQAGAYT